MLERHYAPRARLILFDGDERAAVEGQVAAAIQAGGAVAAVLLEGALPGATRTVTLPRDPARYAQALYATLHQFDALGIDLIVLQRPPDAPAWDAIHDRLQRAATSTPRPRPIP